MIRKLAEDSIAEMFVERPSLKVIGVEVDADAIALVRLVLSCREEPPPVASPAMRIGDP
jgi:hypothetical protein